MILTSRGLHTNLEDCIIDMRGHLEQGAVRISAMMASLITDVEKLESVLDNHTSTYDAAVNVTSMNESPPKSPSLHKQDEIPNHRNYADEKKKQYSEKS